MLRTALFQFVKSMCLTASILSGGQSAAAADDSDS